MRRSIFIYLVMLLLLGVHFFLLFNLQFTAWPEMLSYPYLRNHGFLIYKDMIYPYPPLLTMALSLRYSLFGYELWVLQATAWGVILLSGVVIFLITKYITKSDKHALLALGGYVFLQPFLEGNMLWFDLVIVLPVLLGLLFLLRRKLFLAGLFLAVAVLIKQTAGLFFLATVFYLVIAKTPFSKFKYLFLGPLILGGPLLIRLLQEGALKDFFNWVFWYPLTKWGSIVGYVQMEMSVREWMVVTFLFIPLILMLLRRQRLFQDTTLQILSLFLVGALISVYPRFSFFHFQTAISLLIILYGYLLSKAKITRLTIAYCLVPIALVFLLIHQPVIARDWQKEARFYGQEEREMAQIITDRVNKEEKVYLLGLSSSLYVMSDRLPPKRWSDNFAWYLEIPGVQEEIISRWEGNPPKVIFWRTPFPGNWFDLETYQPKKIVSWIEQNYTKKEEVKPGIWLWILRQAQD